MPAGLDGRVSSFEAFVTAVRDAGPMATTEEAERAARTVLGEVGGCLSMGAAENLAGHLPEPLRQLVRDRRFDSSMSRFAPRVFLRQVGADVGPAEAAQGARAVLRTLDLLMPAFLSEGLHAELASLWGPLTLAEDGQPAAPDRSEPAPSSVASSAVRPLTVMSVATSRS
jgi:uncharacterized protein (DUF2267 family)